MPVSRPLLPLAAVLTFAALLAGCGGDAGGDAAAGRDPVQALNEDVRDAVAAARDVDPSAFPEPPAGQSLEAFAAQFDTRGPQAVAASSVLRPPESRLAFGLLDEGQRFAYGRTVVYLQRRGARSAVEGPIAAPADVLVTEPRYRSQQAASDDDPFAAIYHATVPTPEPGIYDVLVVSDLGDRRIASTTGLKVRSAAKDLVPDVGEKAPAVRTDTLGSVKGNMELLTTRIPPTGDLARESFHEVLGKEPVALLFATPQLCQSRVCGPVTDEMLQLKARYGDRMTFIHQEVYEDNDPAKGLREPLRRFNLPTEPWLFTVDADGRIAARLEGSIGLEEFEAAIKAALD